MQIHRQLVHIQDLYQISSNLVYNLNIKTENLMRRKFVGKGKNELFFIVH